MKKLEEFYSMTNIAEKIDDDVLNKIGEQVVRDYDIDKRSRKDWEDMNEEALNLARQIRGSKTWAGEAVANVKYPTLATAAVQFSARAYPNIIKGTKVVKCQVVGNDPEGIKRSRGDRVSEHMSWQILEQMEDWEEDTDQLLTSLPIIGVMFRKTFYDPSKGINRSELVFPDNLIVNNSAKSLETAPRITHIIELTPNEVEERFRSETFLRKELGDPSEGDTEDRDNPHVFLEQHRWWDLDEDGYQEPYIITVHKESSLVVRIAARYDLEGIKLENGKVIRIEPVHYFTMYPFMPSMDGSFYKCGFGAMLSPLNETINTTINQILDAGTLNNRQGGFLGVGIKLGKHESLKFKIGEWKPMNMTGDDLRKGIVPLPTKEPSQVLFQLLNLMVDASKELASTADILTGEQPAAGVPATTTLAMIEQGLKVFSSIYKRIHRALKSEFRKLRRLNYLHMPEEVYAIVLDDPNATREDYLSSDFDVIPIADSSDLTDIQRLTKAKALLELRGQGLDDMEITRRYLEALDVSDIETLFPKETPPDPKLEMEMRELDQKDRELAIREREVAAEEALTAEKINKLKADTIKSLADAESKEEGAQLQEYMRVAEALKIDNQIKEEAISRLKRSVYGNQRGVPELETAPDNGGGIPANQGIEGEPEGIAGSGGELEQPVQ